MKWLAVDFYECQNNSYPQNRQPEHQKINKSKQFIKNKHYYRRGQKNYKLPRRYRADNFIFHVDKLWDNELLHFDFTKPPILGWLGCLARLFYYTIFR